MPIDLLADSGPAPIDLLAEEPSSQAFEDLSPEDQAKVMEMTKQQISAQHPNMPDWMRDLMLQLTPKNKSPMLESAAKGISDVTNYIPAAAGGALQGASIPIRGVASMIPTEFTQKLANSPDLRTLFPQAEGTGQKSVQMASELLAGGGLFGKLMQGVKGAAAVAKVPKMLQGPASLAGAGYIATPGQPMDKAIGAGGALALGGAGNVAGKVAGKVGEKIPPFLRGLASKSTPEELVAAVQKPHDQLSSTADQFYDQVRQAVKKRDIKIPMKDKFLDQAREYFPKNKTSVNELFDRAKQGDYEAIHKIQSSLYKKGTKQLSGDDLVKENEGEDIIDLRDRMNDFLEKHLLKEGNIDVAHVLRQGKKAHKQIMDTYYAPHLRKGIGKMVNHETRLVPKNPEKLFDQDSVPMKDFLGKHPDAAKHVMGIKEKQEALKALKNMFGGVAGTGGAVYLTKSAYDLLK
tara:strand:+ start:16079 stop:17464 length:1386 start_codon:yes stop_codon:yes gene_type:complete